MKWSMFQKLNTLKRNVLKDTIVILNYFCPGHFLVNLLERDGKFKHLVHDTWIMSELDGAGAIISLISFGIIVVYQWNVKWIVKNSEDLI